MNSPKGLQREIEAFFKSKENEAKHLVFDQTFFVCRNDGVILYYHGHDENINRDSVGALVGGLWQAGSTVIDLFGKEKEPMSFRLSFDTSSSGIHILPFNVLNDHYFMGLYFSEQMNPALLKNKMRMIMEELRTSFIDFSHSYDKVEADEKQLFNNITDDEIDNLFSFAENP